MALLVLVLLVTMEMARPQSTVFLMDETFMIYMMMDIVVVVADVSCYLVSRHRRLQPLVACDDSLVCCLLVFACCREKGAKRKQEKRDRQ